jgi:ribosome assembly protein 4
MDRYLGTFRGHIGEVYQVTWSSDSRLIASGSKDSTLKVWSVKQQKVINQLPGHADEVSRCWIGSEITLNSHIDDS